MCYLLLSLVTFEWSVDISDQSGTWTWTSQCNWCCGMAAFNFAFY